MEVQCRCPSCGREISKEELAVAHVRGFGCPKCRLKLMQCNGILVQV